MKPLRVLFAFALLLGACSESGPTTTVINSAEGGTVASATHTIDIPALSLASDTEVTLDMPAADAYPPVPGDRSVILTIEPEGTVLEIPATLVIHGSQIGASADETVAVYRLVDGAWAPREFSRDVETGDITTSITVFGPIGIGISAPVAGTTLQGTIAWGDGTPVADAPIQLYQGDTLVQETTSNAEGLYRFEGLEAGTYSIRVNYECMIDQGVSVSGDTVTQDLVLCAPS